MALIENGKPRFKKTVNQKFLDEARELEKRWTQSGLLKSLEDTFKRQTVAVLLENQRLMNEQAVNLDSSEFKRLKIPLWHGTQT